MEIAKTTALVKGAQIGDYALLAPLAEQGATATWLARSQTTDQDEVVIKMLRLRSLENWKQLEHFERETALLKHLQHPGLPRLLETFRQETPDGLLLCLVQQKLPGLSLEQKMLRGWQPTLGELLDIAEQALEILRFLHGHGPPVVHRDIKPSNLMLDEQGKVCLIDFGAVQQALEPEGGTVVGTFGYMPPEQFAGQAVPASDLYALGATLVHLLARKAPSEMVYTGTRLRFEPYVQAPVAVKHWLGKLLAPLNERTPDANEALTGLRALRPALGNQSQMAPSVDSRRLQWEAQGDDFICREPERFNTVSTAALLTSLLFFDVGVVSVAWMLYANSGRIFGLFYMFVILAAVQFFAFSQLRRRTLQRSGDKLISKSRILNFETSKTIPIGEIRSVTAASAFSGWQVEVQAGSQAVLLGGLRRGDAEGVTNWLRNQVLEEAR